MKSKLSLFLGLLVALALFVILRNGETSPSAPEKIPVGPSAPTLAAEQNTTAPDPLPESPQLVANEAATKIAPTAAVPEPIDANSLAHLPIGTLRTQLSALPAPVLQKALRKLEELSVPSEDLASLRVTLDGKFYYSRDVPHPTQTHSLGASLVARGTSAAAIAGTGAAAVPVANPPIHHSKPGSTNVIYLDFNGHTITGTSWNMGEGAAATYVGKPFDTDGDSTTFSDAEQAIITEVWQRVSEDYAPFDVDVTTEAPTTFTNTTAHALITPKLDANGIAMPSSSGGGVAFTGVFGDDDYATMSSPAFTYSDSVNNSADGIADATSHEVGHNLGLSHDGQSEEYYDGHGTGETSWGPIMGSPYDQNVNQWSKGEYFNSTNPQDDFAIISAKIPYRTDEAGGTIQAAAAATVNGSTISNTGIIANGTDLDIYSFTTASGNLSFSVDGYRAGSSTNGGNGTNGGNTDFKLELLDSGGNAVATHDPAGATNAALTHTATAGTYYVRISPAAEGTPFANPANGYTAYGSAGQYTLTGTIVAAAPSITSATTASIGAGESYRYNIIGTNGPTSYQATGLPSGLSVNPTTGLISGRPTAIGGFNISLSATNSLGTGTGSLTLTVTDAAPVITAQSTGRIAVTPGASQSLSVTALSANGTPSYEWFRNGHPISGATDATFDLSTMGPGDSGYYRAQVTNTVGTTVSDIVFALYAPTNSEVVGWGLNTSGQRTIPSDLNTAISVTAGKTHTLALKSDGTVVAWGSNVDGETTVPANLTDVVKLAAGEDVSFALKSDGTVVAWGSSGFTTGNPPSDLANVVDLTAGGFHALALKSDGTIVSWGSNGNGQLTLPANIGTVLNFATSSGTTYAIDSAGTVFAFGFTGNGVTEVPAASPLWRSVSGGGFHALGLKSDGTVEGWGFSTYATPPSGLSNVVAIAAGNEHSLALKSDGTITAWGDNTHGERTVPSGLSAVFSIAASDFFSIAIKEVTVIAPAITAHPGDQTVTAGASASFSVTATGFPVPSYQWRKDGTNITGATSPTLTIGTTTTNDTGNYDVIVTNTSGSVTSSGATLTLQTLPDITSAPQPQTVIIGTNVTLTVAASGVPPPDYQWRKNSVNIDGATTSSLAFGTVSLSDTGSYDVVVSNVVGNVTSTPATVTVQETPAITTHPVSQTVNVGISVAFTVEATGTPAPTYQWRKNGTNIADATSSSFGLSGVSLNDAGSYDVVVTNDVTSVTSTAATLTVQVAPAITTHPQSQRVNSGASVTLSATVTGLPTPTLQWRKDGQNIDGATTASLDLGAVSPGANGNYYLVATNSVGTAASNSANVTVQFGPSINIPPASQTVTAGTSVTFTVAAAGAPTPTYQWQKDGSPITGETSASYTIPATASSDAGDYTVVVTNSVTSVTSSAATLTVTLGAAITTQPVSQTVTLGTQVTLSVVATGSPAPTYQWRKNGSPIPGATSPSLALGNVSFTDSGNYDVVVTNATGSTISETAVVVVQEAPVITIQPISQVVPADTSVAFIVEATGTPAPSFQWRKDGVNILGATSSSLGLSSVGAAEAGSYTVAVFNDAGTVTSDAATLTIVSVTGTHASDGYRLGTGVTINNSVNYTGDLSSLVWSVVPPADIGGQKWSLSATGGTAADVSPTVGTTDLLDFTWNNVPTSPFTFSYSLVVPDATAGDHNLTAMFESTSSAGTLQGIATPDPLVLSEATTVHSADTNSDLRIGLSELLRVIELYNTRLGTTRTGRYQVQTGTEDGFAPDPTEGTTQSSFHAADFNRDSKISLSELLRVIELYNTRSGTTRTGEYHLESGTEDGFAPGPAS